MIRKQAIVFLALFCLAANAEIYSSVVADVTDGLIGHWKLDEMSYDGTAGEVIDSSGNGNHGFTLGLPKTNPGVNNRSLVIDSRWGISKNPMAVIPHTDSLTLSGDFTVCLWVYPLHNGSTLIAKRTNAEGSEFSITLSASSGYITMYSAGVSRTFVTPSLLNKWSYLTVCRSNTYFSVSVNGVNYGTSDSVFTPLGCQAEIGIGAARLVSPSGGRYSATSGNYDDVRIYNRVLSSNEVKMLYNLGAAKHPVVAYSVSGTKTNICAVYTGNKLISNPEKKDYPNTVSENIEPVEPVTLTFEYVSTYPATITIGGTGYGQPVDPSKALVDAGDGVFVPWTSNTITLKGNRIRFRGDWRNSSGNFRDLFNRTFADGNDVTMSGGFDLDGAHASSMFRATFYECSNLIGSIPSGLFGNISGAPADYMFAVTFYKCSNLTGSIPSGLFGNISGAPAPSMFNSTFYNCSNLSGSIPSGLFGNISGAPASSMFYSTFTGCGNLTGESALMPDGVTHLYDQFPTAIGNQCDNCYLNATGLDDYATMPIGWK